MRGLLRDIARLKKSSIKQKINSRLKEFKRFKRKSSEDIFKELCFCILTANSTAERCINIHNRIGDGFLVLSSHQLKESLRQHGARFHTKRAEYISEARRYKSSIKNIIRHVKDKNRLRDWLVKNIKGIGYKEASHFLRNIGYNDFAIIDFHIIDILAKNRIIERPKSLTREKYLEIEEELRKIAEKTDLSLGELDLYLWYLETGKVLK